jgi:quercetin dioxygenase-like cupin family protein
LPSLTSLSLDLPTVLWDKENPRARRLYERLGCVQLCAWRLEVPAGLEGVAHRPTRDEVLVVLGGELRLTLDGVRTTLHAGEVALVPADSELRVDAGASGSTVWVTTTPGIEAVTSDGGRITPPLGSITGFLTLAGSAADRRSLWLC